MDGTPYDPVVRRKENERSKGAKGRRQPKEQEAAAADDEEEDDVEDEHVEDDEAPSPPLSPLPSPPPPMPPPPSPPPPEDDVEDEEDEDDEGTPLSQLPSPPPPMPPSPSPDRHHRRRRLRRAWSTHAAFVLKPMISTARWSSSHSAAYGVARFHHRCMWIWYRYWKTRASELAQLGLCAAWQWQDKVVACPCCRTSVKVSRARSARAQGSVSE